MNKSLTVSRKAGRPPVFCTISFDVVSYHTKPPLGLNRTVQRCSLVSINSQTDTSLATATAKANWHNTIFLLACHLQVSVPKSSLYAMNQIVSPDTLGRSWLYFVED